ncbi:MAG TPA: FAD-binding oxidoreductase [Solirubrobacterales bacterium]|nr:FAD-binding oxidoreductase [Solirubrobacterales bacterium]
MSTPQPDAGPLREALAGEVIAGGETGWDAARQAWNLTADQRPPLVVFAESAADIAATVRFAAANGLRVAPQSTGHGATSMGDLADAILLKTSRLTGVAIDPSSRTATVEAGALWSDVVPPAAEHGLVALHGMSAAVGVAGYTLGGGIGWLVRREGFASTHVRAFEVVGADGEARRIDAGTDPDLFWALRGGGGRPAIVTSFELELFELREAYAGALIWPIEQAEAVVKAWGEWISTVPNELTSTLKLLRYPPLPTVADQLRGRSVVAITLAFTGTEERGGELVAPLRAIATPYMDTLATVTGAGLADVAGDPTNPLRALGHAVLVDRIDSAALDAYLAFAGPGVDIPLPSVEIRQLGGALRDSEPDPGAAGVLEAEGLAYATGPVPSPEAEPGILAALDEFGGRLDPFAGARATILTFDERRPMTDAFAPHVAARLAKIAEANDPDGLFVGNHVAD